MKKLILLYLSILLTVNAHATGFYDVDGFRYIVRTDNNTAILCPLIDKKYSGDIIIPKEITVNGNIYPVKELSDKCFDSCSELKSVIIPKGVTSLGNQCFYGCSSLTSVTILEGVTSLGNKCFYGCSSLTSVNIPEGVISIGKSCFYGCSSLTSVNIPEGVISIGKSCFCGCSSLTSVTIHEGVTSLGDSCFYDCSNLTSVNIPEGVTSLGNFCFEDCSNLTSVNIPEGVTSLGNYCFYDCSNLTSVNIPEGVTLGVLCFGGCSSLTSINIPEGVTLRGSCFAGCSFTSINIPGSVKFESGSGYFQQCTSLNTVIFNPPIRYLGTTSKDFGAFYGCDSLMFISIPSSVYEIRQFFPNKNKYLEKCYCYAVKPPYLYDNFAGPYSILFVPEQSIDLYKKASNWKNFYLILPIEGEATYVSKEKLYGDVKTSSKDGTVTLSNLRNGETVSFYSVDGKKIGQTVVTNGKVSLKAGSEAVVIARYGVSTIKIAVK